MTPERFHTLVEAWGADPRRWPDHERSDALAWARAHRAQADAVLEAALELDAWLARDTVEPPSRALQEQIVASAPRRAEPTPKRLNFWWPSAAFAGAGLAGAFAGALAMSLMLVGQVRSAAYDVGHDLAHESSFLEMNFGDMVTSASNEGSNE